MAGPNVKGGRDIVAHYAGYLAHLLNGEGQGSVEAVIVEIRAFQLYERIFTSLTRNKYYRDHLVGVWAYPPPFEKEAAAEFYFDHVLDRPIARRGNQPSSSENLRDFMKEKAVGPRCAERNGPLSLWKAMTDGPNRIRRLRQGEEIFALVSLILKCLDAANRPYAEVLRLGLCPKDWLDGEDETPVNMLKAANLFLRALKGIMNRETGRRPTAEELEAAFAEAPIPHHASGMAFAQSPLGAAILSRLAGQDGVYFVPYEEEGFAFTEEREEEGGLDLLTEEEALPLIERAIETGEIASDEGRLLLAILNGGSLADAMKTDLGLRRRLKYQFDGDLGLYIANLSSRLATFAKKEQMSRP